MRVANVEYEIRTISKEKVIIHWLQTPYSAAIHCQFIYKKRYAKAFWLKPVVMNVDVFPG